MIQEMLQTFKNTEILDEIFVDLSGKQLEELDHYKKSIAEKLFEKEDVLTMDQVVADKDLCLCDVCEDTPPYFQSLLFPKAGAKYGNFHYRKGLIISVCNQPLGFVKFVGERTFLAAKTVKNSSGNYPLIKGGIYSIDCELYGGLRPRPRWYLKNLDDFHVFPLAFIELNNYKLGFHSYKQDPDILKQAEQVMEKAKKALNSSKTLRKTIYREFEILD